MLLIISAIYSEIELIIKELKASQISENAWATNDKKVLLSSVGVGSIDAAINLQYIFFQYPQIEKVVFCGTAGAYLKNSNFKIGTIYIGKETFLCDGAAEMKLSQYAFYMSQQGLKSDFNLKQNIEKAKVATTLTITKDDNLASIIARNTKADLENLELFGLAKVCVLHKKVWTAILGVTNYIGKEGHLQWKQNHKRLEKEFNKKILLLLNKYINE
jgi:nucleoside phosphorylase